MTWVLFEPARLAQPARPAKPGQTMNTALTTLQLIDKALFHLVEASQPEAAPVPSTLAALCALDAASGRPDIDDLGPGDMRFCDIARGCLRSFVMASGLARNDTDCQVVLAEATMALTAGRSWTQAECFCRGLEHLVKAEQEGRAGDIGLVLQHLACADTHEVGDGVFGALYKLALRRPCSRHVGAAVAELTRPIFAAHGLADVAFGDLAGIQDGIARMRGSTTTDATDDNTSVGVWRDGQVGWWVGDTVLLELETGERVSARTVRVDADGTLVVKASPADHATFTA